MADRLICTKCGKSKRDTDFFMMKTGSRCDMCKSCLTMHIDNYKPDTFMWILEKFDVPYIEDSWVSLTNKIYMKNPGKFGSGSVIGQYLRTMNMNQYRDYTYADTEKLSFEAQKAQKEAEAKRAAQGIAEDYEEQLLAKLEAGEISEAEYQTLTHTNAAPLPQTDDRGFIQPVTIDDDKIRDQLSEEDMQYLALKWGLFWKPSQWVQLEELYTRYLADVPDMNTDREDVLKKICKTSLKMDEALDMGDISTYKNLASVHDSLRKSGKFTEAQKKEETVRKLDAIGELVRFVERNGGAIPCEHDPIEHPQDIIDFCIRDMKNYTRNLVTNELGLGDLIETFIERAEKQKTETVEEIVANSFKSEEEDALTEEEVADFQEFRMREIEEESRALLEEFGGL